MRESQLPKKRCTDAEVLLKRMCPLRYARGSKYRIAKNGTIYFQGGWRKISSVIRRRKTEADRVRKKYRTNSTFRKNKCIARNESRLRHLEHERERCRRYWQSIPAAVREAKNRERCRRSREERIQRIPTTGIRRALTRFRRGEITLGQLNRFYADALARLDAHCRKGRAGVPEDKPGDDQRGMQHSETNAGFDAT